MTIQKVKGFKIFRDRHGKWRCYHRSSGTPVDLVVSPLGSSQFLVECARILKRTEMGTERSGTFGALLRDYCQSPDFQRLATQTRHNYQSKIDYLSPLGPVPLASIDRPFVVKVRDKAIQRGPEFANYVKAVLSVVLRWGAERGYLQDNPATGIKRVRNQRTGIANRPWSDEERETVLRALPPHMLTVVALLMFTGLGPKDALTLTKDRISNDAISTSRSKTGEAVFLPMPRRLREVLATAPAHESTTVCANLKGKPWTLSGFRASWRPIRKRLQEQGAINPGLTLYGLRHSVAVILRESGHDERTIADYLGQRTIEMARHYARGADLGTKMRDVVGQLDREWDKRSDNLSNLDAKASNLPSLS